MDKSDEYILMCKEASIYLPKHEAESGDWYADDCYGLHVLGIHAFLPSNGKTHAEICEEEYIWLPRQDQLQSLSFEKKPALSVACIFKDFIVRPMFDEHMLNRKEQMAFFLRASMEQLWLAFVMYIKYHKIWDGTSWKEEVIKQG